MINTGVNQQAFASTTQTFMDSSQQMNLVFLQLPWFSSFFFLQCVVSSKLLYLLFLIQCTYEINRNKSHPLMSCSSTQTNVWLLHQSWRPRPHGASWTINILCLKLLKVKYPRCDCNTRELTGSFEPTHFSLRFISAANNSDRRIYYRWRTTKPKIKKSGFFLLWWSDCNCRRKWFHREANCINVKAACVICLAHLEKNMFKPRRLGQIYTLKWQAGDFKMSGKRLE